jgi:Dynamin family
VSTQVIGTGLDALADGLEPGGNTAAAIVKHVRECLGKDAAELVADGLRRVAARLRPVPVRIIVGGHFSSGKSSLINMLIGTELLPASDFPETGVPCLLQSGEASQVLVQTGRRPKSIPFSSAAIAAYVSLTGSDGRYRDSVFDVRELRVTLANRPIPADATWVDSPGINDVRLKETAAGLARGGDILVWVINSRQPLALTEQEFLRAHIAEAGPASVVFILNAFLDTDTPRAWEAFTARQHGYVSQLIATNIDTGSVPASLVSASARAATAAADAFGGPQARALLASLSEPAAPRVTATRVFRAAAELRDLVAKLNARLAAEEQRLAPERAKIAAIERERAQQQDDFERAVRQEITGLLAGYARTADSSAAPVITELMKSSVPKAPDYYATQLNEKLRIAMDVIARDAVRRINKQVRAHGRRKLDDAGQQAIASALRPRRVRIAGYAKPNVEGFRQKLGEWWNSGTNQKNAIEAELNYAASDAAARMLEASARITAEADRHCAVKARPVPAVDERRPNALRDAIRTLESNVGDPLARALAAAQTQAGG